MDNDTATRGPKSIICRWENRNGKKFVELYQQVRGSSRGIGCDSHLGSSWYGDVSVSRALSAVENDRRFSVDQMVEIPLAMAQAA